MALSILELTACAGHHQRLEARLAEVVGGWARTDAEPSAAVLFAAHSAQFAWHADLWLDRLPEQPSTTLRQFATEAPPAQTDVPRFDQSLIHSVDTLAVATDTIERLVGAYQLVLPRLLATCEAVRERTDDRIDGPTARLLDLVGRDLSAAIGDGTDLLQRLRLPR